MTGRTTCSYGNSFVTFGTKSYIYAYSGPILVPPMPPTKYLLLRLSILVARRLYFKKPKEHIKFGESLLSFDIEL